MTEDVESQVVDSAVKPNDEAVNNTLNAVGETEKMKDRAWVRRGETIYRSELSALYHLKRERFFELVDKLTKAGAVIGGSAALYKFHDAGTPAWITFAITVCSAFSLVFSFSERSKRHAELAKSYRELLAEIARVSEYCVTDELATIWTSKVRELEVKEPPPLTALTIMCQNEIAIAHGRKEDVIELPPIVRLMSHFFDMPDAAGGTTRWSWIVPFTLGFGAAGCYITWCLSRI